MESGHTMIPASSYQSDVKSILVFFIEVIIYLVIIFPANAMLSPLMAEEPVHFTDAVLKAAVEGELLVSDPTPADMLNLFSLNAHFEHINNLTGLEYATNLQSLWLRGNEIKDVTPLSSLVNLQHLDLSRNDISDISALSNLANLRHLDVHWNQISNISVVSGLTSLATLIVRLNRDLTVISAVSNLTGLKNLDIQVTNVSDISSLVSLTNLEYLNMNRTQIRELSTLSGMTQLKKLYLLGNNVRDLSPLLGLTSLEALNLTKNQLNQEAYISHLQLISEHNPGIDLTYDPNPRAPDAVKASNGNYADKIWVTWDEVPNGPAYTSYYQVYRALSTDSTKESVSSWSNGRSFGDDSASPGVTYYYWIRSAVSQAGLSPGNYSAWVEGTFGSYRPTLTLSSSSGGSIVLPGEGLFEVASAQVVSVQATPIDTILYVFSHWTGTAVDADKVADPYAATTSVTVDGDYTLRAQFVSLLETLYVDDEVFGYSIENGSLSFPLKHIADALEVASDETTVKVLPGLYTERLELGVKAIRLFGYDPDNPAISSFPVIDGNNQGPVIRVTGDADCWLSGFVITGGLAETGSALECDGGRLEMTHCLVVGNRATNPDGGVVNCHDSSARFINCTMTDNLGGMVLIDSDVEILNTILWGNINSDLHLSAQPVPVISYCDIGVGWDLSSGNIDRNPLFVRQGSWRDALNTIEIVNPQDMSALWLLGDYHLRSAFGRWDEDSQQWLVDGLSSVCIDGGDPTIEVGYEPEPNGGRVNMGVYGGTDQASQSKE